jgi:hypothetical protein
VAITTENGVTFLVIENITADDSGKYVVSVENGVGADCNFASVAVEGTSMCHRFQAFKRLCVGGTGMGEATEIKGTLLLLLLLLLLLFLVVYDVTKISTIKYSGVQIYILSSGPNLAAFLLSRSTPRL